MIRLAKPYLPQNALQRVVEILKTGNLVQGEHVEKFENSLGRYLETGHAIVVSSGTAALHLSLISLGIGKGDEVIVPAFTFPATANCVELVGARPVFVDIELDGFCIDCAKIEAKITAKTKAIMPVHEFGQPADIEKIIEIAGNHHLKVIEDAACALGSEFNGKKAGTFGEMGCFSFHPRKAMTTGEGGLVTTNDKNIAMRLRILRNHGMTLEQDRPDFVAPGFNYRMTDFQAALGDSQMRSLDDSIAHRMDIAKRYDELLSPIEWIHPPKRFENRKMVYQSYHILIDKGVTRDNVMTQLRQAGIETNFGAYALNCLSFYKKKYKLEEADFPNAVFAYRQGLVLPMGSHIGTNEIHSIAGCLQRMIPE